MKYTINYFIKKFKAITANRWCVDRFRNKEKRCALGHCGSTGSRSTTASRALEKLFQWHHLNVTVVNDGISQEFKQDNPKKRILAALNSMKKEKI